MVASYRLALESANRSEGTIRSYEDTIKLYVRYADVHALPITVDDVDADAIRRFLLAARAGCWIDDDEVRTRCECGLNATSPGNAHKHYRNLRAFFGWLIKEQELLGPHPMAAVVEPEVPDNPEDVFTDDELRALVKVCDGATFESRRDLAIIRIFMDTGMRAGGLTGLRYHPTDPDLSDVDLSRKQLTIHLKGGRIRRIPLGAKAAAALDRYVRARARHKDVAEPWLWLSVKGRFTQSGVRQMLERRAKEAGVRNVHPQRFRHTFVDDWLESGGTVQDVMEVGGWKSAQAALRYGRAANESRAHTAHARLSPGDRI